MYRKKTIWVTKICSVNHNNLNLRNKISVVFFLPLILTRCVSCPVMMHIGASNSHAYQCFVKLKAAIYSWQQHRNKLWEKTHHLSPHHLLSMNSTSNIGNVCSARVSNKATLVSIFKIGNSVKFCLISLARTSTQVMYCSGLNIEHHDKFVCSWLMLQCATLQHATDRMVLKSGNTLQWSSLGALLVQLHYSIFTRVQFLHCCRLIETGACVCDMCEDFVPVRGCWINATYHLVSSVRPLHSPPELHHQLSQGK